MKRTIQCRHEIDIDKCGTCYPVFLKETSTSDPQKLSSASHSNDELELELSRIPNMHPLSVPYVMRFISTYYSRKVTKVRCKRGHKLEEPNIYIKPSTGTRECVECRRIRRKRVAK